MENKENKKLRFCTASLVLNSRPAVLKQSFLFPLDSDIYCNLHAAVRRIAANCCFHGSTTFDGYHDK